MLLRVRPAAVQADYTSQTAAPTGLLRFMGAGLSCAGQHREALAGDGCQRELIGASGEHDGVRARMDQ